MAPVAFTGSAPAVHGAPHPSVYREVQRAEQAGLVTTRKVGNTRLVRANTDSPSYAGLADILTRAFGVPAVLAEALRHVRGAAADLGGRLFAAAVTLDEAFAAAMLRAAASARPY